MFGENSPSLYSYIVFVHCSCVLTIVLSANYKFVHFPHYRRFWLIKETADRYGFSVFVIDYLEVGNKRESETSDVTFYARIIDDMSSCNANRFVWIDCQEFTGFRKFDYAENLSMFS